MRASRCWQFVGSMALASALASAAPSRVDAYYVEARPAEGDGGADVPIAWPTETPVEWRFADPDLPDGISAGDAAAAIDAAFQAWGSVECSTLAFVRGEDEAMPRYDFYMDSLLVDGTPNPDYDPRYVVFFSRDTTTWRALGSSSDAPVVGLSFFAFDLMGRLNGATIMLNSADHQWTTGAMEAGKFDVQSVVTTLIGRSLGLYSTDPMASLYPRYRQNDTEKRSLEEEDRNALRFIYNDAADAACMPPPAPDMICLGMLRTPGCPPPVMGMPPGPDGGTPTPPPPPGDGGSTPPPPPSDGGAMVRDTGTGGGGGDDDDGCSCSAPGVRRSHDRAGVLAMLAVGLAGAVWLARRRRR